jgi:hypothetical protein
MGVRNSLLFMGLVVIWCFGLQTIAIKTFCNGQLNHIVKLQPLLALRFANWQIHNVFFNQQLAVTV